MMAIKNDDDWLDFDWSQNGSSTSVNTQNFSQMGTISLMLTLANIVFVACGATLMFRLKEVLPVKTPSPAWQVQFTRSDEIGSVYIIMHCID